MERFVKMSRVPVSNENFEDFEKDLEELLHEHHQSRTAALDRERELNLYRSGSAPPTVEGSRTAIRSLWGPSEAHRIDGRNARDMLSEEELRSHPNYLSDYYSNDNLNPRMPLPLLSREDWRVAQRFQVGNSSFGGIGDQRKELGEGDGSSSSLFSLQPGLLTRDGERELGEPNGGAQQNLAQHPSAEWLERGNDGLIGLPDIGLGVRRKSFTDAFQEDFGRFTSISRRPSRPVSRNAYDTVVDPKGLSDVHLAQLHSGMGAVGGLHSGATSPGLVRVQSLGSTMSQSFASAVGSSLSRSTTPDPQLLGRSSSTCLPPSGGRLVDADKKIVSNGFGGTASRMADCGDMAVALSGLNLSNDIITDGENHVQCQLYHEFSDQSEMLYNMHSDHNQYMQQKNIKKPESESLNVPAIPSLAYNDFSMNTRVHKDDGLSALTSNGQINLPEQSSSINLSKKVDAVGYSLARSSGQYPTDMTNIDFSGCNSNAYLTNQGLPAMLNNQLNEGAGLASGSEGQYLNRTGRQTVSAFQVPVMDPLYAQYLQRASDYSANLSDPSLGRSYLGTSHMDMHGYHKAYLGALLAQQKLQYGGSLSKSGGLSNGFYGSSGFGLRMPYPTLAPGSPLRQNDPLSRFPSTLKSGTGGSKGSWNHENGIMEEGFASTLLEEFKNNKSRVFELSEIAEHVVEFSADQYGSRFIQQKLETASVEEKNKIFLEILPHARVLMTDVFGNYVIQKFFEHGTESHRNQLASQLLGHVLPLSLQMYGCRVIQKALEVVDVDQQTEMVSELDGSIMKCVRDQNGNHVIQKCIECVPQERIQFIISSFYGQVVALSTHPYGCRVIQRVLEHCDDAKTQSIMMDEIMRSVCTLAQDQYGNYVVQHVLQHGKQKERTAIISKLAGQIVKMSQQKFASNVVEKCLTYGTPEERQLLINEMLGSTDENEPLQAMMKDQFGNYVVQKILETCDDRNRELILSRIKVHLNALKRYTYGKHIVARVEKLIAAGERRIGMPSVST